MLDIGERLISPVGYKVNTRVWGRWGDTQWFMDFEGYYFYPLVYELLPHLDYLKVLDKIVHDHRHLYHCMHNFLKVMLLPSNNLKSMLDASDCQLKALYIAHEILGQDIILLWGGEEVLVVPILENQTVLVRFIKHNIYCDENVENFSFAEMIPDDCAPSWTGSVDRSDPVILVTPDLIHFRRVYYPDAREKAIRMARYRN
ncbi:hypothetical protein [Spongorhabdus nitratireducens]